MRTRFVRVYGLIHCVHCGRPSERLDLHALTQVFISPIRRIVPCIASVDASLTSPDHHHRVCVCFADAHSLCSAHVFDGDAEQVDVYTEAVDDLVHHFFLGYNGTVMAHGKCALT